MKKDSNNTSVKYNTKKVVLLIIFCIAITVFVFTMLLSFNDFKGISEAIRTVDIKYLTYALLMILAYFILYPVTLCILVKSKKINNVSIMDTYLIGSTEHFFNGITPFATGGQPFQVYAFKQFDVKLSDSSGILVMNFIIFMIVTNLYAMISLFFYPLLAKNISNLLAMVIIGFGINFFVLLFMISIATSKRLRKLLENALLWLCKFKWLKKFIEPNIEVFNDYCLQTQNAFKELWHHKGAFAACFVVRFITMGIYYATTYFILKALHVSVTASDLPFIISSTAFAITMCVFIPTPGSSGGIEFAFKSIFQAIAVGITTEVALGGMMLWRLLSYYLVLIISLVIYLILQHKIVKKYKREIALSVANSTESENANSDTQDGENVVLDENFVSANGDTTSTDKSISSSDNIVEDEITCNDTSNSSIDEEIIANENNEMSPNTCDNEENNAN